MLSVVMGGLAAAVFGADGNVVLREDFEKGLDGWTAAGSVERWCVVEGQGMPAAYATPATKGLVYTRKEGDADSRYIWREVPVKPGQRLRITAWILAEGIKCTPNQTPKVSVGIGNAKGCPTWKGSLAYSETDEKGFEGWHRISMVTDPVKSGCDRMQLCLCLSSETFGTVRYDNVTVEVADNRLVDRLGCTATCRTASHGKVSFSARVYDEGKVLLVAPGWEREMTRTDDRAELTVDVADLPMGETTLKVRLVGTDSKTLDEKPLVFTRTAEEPSVATRKVRFVSARRLVVDGKPTYPIGLYWHYNVTETNDLAFADLEASPFNFVVAYEKKMRRPLMDRFQRTGRGVFISLASVYGFPEGARAWPPKGVTDVASADRYARDIVTEFRDHPALWGWYTYDELPLEMVPQVESRAKMIHALDPNHPVLGILWDVATVSDYASSSDIIGLDTYPVGDVRSTEEQKAHPVMRSIADRCRGTVAQTRGLKPVWQVPQAYNWHVDFPGKEYEWMRYPTLAECRAQAWYNIACGADGLVYFSCAQAGSPWSEKAAGNPKPYDDLITSVREVARLSDVLLSTETPPKVAGDGKDLAVRAFLHKDQLYVVACNLTWQPMKATLSIEGAWREPQIEVGAPTSIEVEVQGGGGRRTDTCLHLDLPQIGVSVIRLLRLL